MQSTHFRSLVLQLKEIDIDMNDPDATIFKYVQQLIKPFPSSQRLERIKRIFEPTYTYVAYRCIDQ